MATGRWRRAAAGALRDRLMASAEDVSDGDLGRSAIVFAPHPDDETLGCGGTIARKAALGADVVVVFVTDGARSHADLMGADELRALRATEAHRACEVLGVPATHVVWWGIENGRLEAHEPTAAERALALLRERRPAELYVPHAGEPPPEHRAVHRAVRRALRQYDGRPTVYEYPVWLWHHWPHVPMTWRPLRRAPERLLSAARANLSLLTSFRHHVDVREVLATKRAALEAHRSQMTRLVDDPRWHTLADVAGGEWLQCLLQPYELFARYEWAPSWTSAAGAGTTSDRPSAEDRAAATAADSEVPASADHG